jgi:hypothetical protein
MDLDRHQGRRVAAAVRFVGSLVALGLAVGGMLGRDALAQEPGFTFTIEKHSGGAGVGTEPYAPGDQFHWNITVTVTGPAGQGTPVSLEIVDVWDDTVVDLWSIEPPDPFDSCSEHDPGTVNCTFAAGTKPGTYGMALHMEVRNEIAVCETTNNIRLIFPAPIILPPSEFVGLQVGGSFVLDSDSDTVLLDAPCGSVTINKDDGRTPASAVAGATYRLERYDDGVMEALCVTDNFPAPVAPCPGLPGATSRGDENPANGVTSVSHLELGNWQATEVAPPVGYGPDTCGGFRFLGTLSAGNPSGSNSGAGCGSSSPTTAFHNPPLATVIEVCKAWTTNSPGEVPGDFPTDFLFDVSDFLGTTTVTIPGVSEDVNSDPVCIFLQVEQGSVTINEHDMAPLFLAPSFVTLNVIGGFAGGTGSHVQFYAGYDRCFAVFNEVEVAGLVAGDLGRSVEGITVLPGPQSPACTITFTNHDDEGSFTVKKVAQTRHNFGPEQPAPDDDDGWTISVVSAACNINQSQQTDANGNADFVNLPKCSDYVVSENSVNAASPGFVPVGAVTFTNQTPQGQTLTFVNLRSTLDPPCQDCLSPTPTPVTPVPTPTAPLTGATATPTATATATATTATPVSTVAGAVTPAPPKTGAGSPGASLNGIGAFFVLAGLLGLAGSLVLAATALKRGR